MLCEECGSGLGADQAYCLGCGRRVGARGPLLEGLLRRARGPAPDAFRPGPDAAATTSRAALALPSPRVSALLVLVFVGFGVLLGAAASSRAPDTLAASARQPLKVVLPPPQAAAAQAPSPSPTESSGRSSESEAPSAPAEPTPAPSPAASAVKAPASPSTSAATPEPSAPAGEANAPSLSGSTAKLPPVRHVFVIMLSNQPYASVFGPASGAPYLAHTLERKGELLVRYYAVAHEQLANEIALISGQGPTAETAANCPNYADLTPGSPLGDGQVSGHGCVYPSATRALPAQLQAKHLGWRAYVQGIDEAGSPRAACAHPLLGSADPSASGPPTPDPYATFRNPFAYFHSVTGSRACASDVVGLGKLAGDLLSPRKTPSFSYISPDRCHDGDPTPCVGGQPGGLAAADTFLREVVPQILASKAYRDRGLLIITADQAPSSGELADSSSCCGQPRFPNLPPPAAASGTGLPAKGGGQVGALLLSPFVKPGATSQEPYNHFSLLRTIEDLFALPHLGYARSGATSAFAASLFS